MNRPWTQSGRRPSCGATSSASSIQRRTGRMLDMHRVGPRLCRLLVLACVADLASPLTLAQRTAGLHMLLADLSWVPTVSSSPVPFSLVEVWYEGLEGALQTMVEVVCQDVDEESTP